LARSWLWPALPCCSSNKQQSLTPSLISLVAKQYRIPVVPLYSGQQNRPQSVRGKEIEMKSIPRLPVMLILSACMIFGSAWAQGNNPAIEKTVDAFLKPIVDDDLISGCVLIARKGGIVLSKCYGPANREYDIPNMPGTKFRLGSNTKQFTAMGIMILADEGKLSVDDPISTFYPDYHEGSRITIHHLLTHSSGIVNYNSLPDYGEKMLQPLTIDEVIDWFKNEPLQFEPGARFAYSNSGYVILAGIIEKVSGQSYAEFLHDRIFEPLGMHDTGQDVYTEIIKNRATGFGSDGQHIYHVPYRDMPFTSGAGSLYSTIGDLFLWDQSLYTEKLVSHETMEKIFTPHIANYGYGWFIDERFGRKLIWHGGAINGFLSDISRFVDDTILAITLFNYESTFSHAAARGIGAIAVGEEPEPLLIIPPLAVDPAVLGGYAGKYELMPEYILTIGNDGSRLFVQENDGPELDAAAQTEDKFFIRGLNSLIKFNQDESGEVTGLILVQGVHPFRARKIM
jgi:D-alanyl-D-alanine carboxypeptidase